MIAPVMGGDDASHLDGKGTEPLPTGQVEGVASDPYPSVYHHWQWPSSTHPTGTPQWTGGLDPDGLGRPQKDIGPLQTGEGGTDQPPHKRSGTYAGLSRKWLPFLPRDL